jgi:hypothetical protein
VSNQGKSSYFSSQHACQAIIPIPYHFSRVFVFRGPNQAAIGRGLFQFAMSAFPPPNPRLAKVNVNGNREK